MPHTVEQLANEFRSWSQAAGALTSPFYAGLSLRISEDPIMLSIAAGTRDGQPPANMLFGAVKFLLERGASPGLLALYPAGDRSMATVDPYPLFRQFVIEHEAQITALLQTRSVQSNVVRRAAVLLLGLSAVASELDSEPFAHIEIGASLGLTLLWERFSYDYGSGLRFGDEKSPVRLAPELTGTPPGLTTPRFPNVLSTTGIELSPLSLDDADGIAWLEALIWPEHEDNRLLWRAAVPLARQHPPRVTVGDANDVLPNLFAELPRAVPVCAYHSHTLNQFSPVARRRLENMLAVESTQRRVFRLSFEFEYERGHSALRLFEYANGSLLKETRLAECESHGRWIRWL